MPRKDKVLREIFKEVLESNKRLEHSLNLLARKQELIYEELAGKHATDAIILEQMSEYLKDPQGIVDCVMKDYTRQNERMMKELARDFRKACLLINPEIVGMERPNYKLISSQNDPVWSMATPVNDLYAQNTGFGEDINNRAYIRVGYLAILGTSYAPLDEGWTSEPVTAQNLRIVSASASDSPSGTGVRSAVVSGLNDVYHRTSETITLAGTTPVTTVNRFTYIDSFYARAVGSGGFAAGNISATNSGGTSTFGQIAAGENSWRSGRFYVDADQTAYITEWEAGSVTNAARFQLLSSWTGAYPSTGLITRTALITDTSSIQYLFPIPVRVPAQGKIYVRGIGKANTEANTSFTVFVRPS